MEQLGPGEWPPRVAAGESRKRCVVFSVCVAVLLFVIVGADGHDGGDGSDRLGRCRCCPGRCTSRSRPTDVPVPQPSFVRHLRSSLSPSPQTVNLWCCEPPDGGEEDAADARVVHLEQPKAGGAGVDVDGVDSGEERGGDGDCPRLVASVCTRLLCPAYVSRRAFFFIFGHVSFSSGAPSHVLPFPLPMSSYIVLPMLLFAWSILSRGCRLSPVGDRSLASRRLACTAERHRHTTYSSPTAPLSSEKHL